MPRRTAPMSFLRQPLDSILSGTGNVRVLRVLVGHGGAIAVSRLAALTKLTPEGIRGVLADLERAGVVEMLGGGRTRLYRTVAVHPIVAALNALFRAEAARFHAIQPAIAACVADAPIVAVWLFGSVANGSDGIGSDCDLAVVIDAEPGGVTAAADALRDALHEPERRLGFAASVVALSMDDLRRHAAQRSPLLADLLRDGRAVKGPAPARLLESLAANRNAEAA